MIERHCLNKADKVMYLSKYMKHKAIKFHGLNENCLVYNPAGVDLERFKPVANRTKIKEELFFPPDKFHLLTVRNLEHRMGLDNLIIAVCFLRKRGVPVHLVIGGEGPERDNLQNLINKLNLGNDVKMAGFIPDEKLPKYYCAADFFILPTRELEGFGLVTIESMACETPVLGTPVGATTEILSDFNPKMLFKGENSEAIAEGVQTALNKYSLDQKGYNKLRIRCREHVQKKYSWQRHIDQLQSIIHDLVIKDEFKNN
jgi:glycosyltransferase involved in cell wall biosynthesis